MDQSWLEIYGRQEKTYKAESQNPKANLFWGDDL